MIATLQNRNRVCRALRVNKHKNALIMLLIALTMPASRRLWQPCLRPMCLPSLPGVVLCLTNRFTAVFLDCLYSAANSIPLISEVCCKICCVNVLSLITILLLSQRPGQIGQSASVRNLSMRSYLIYNLIQVNPYDIWNTYTSGNENPSTKAVSLYRGVSRLSTLTSS